MEHVPIGAVATFRYSALLWRNEKKEPGLWDAMSSISAWTEFWGKPAKNQPCPVKMAEGVGVGIWRLQHVGVASVESRAGPHVCGHPQGQSEKRGGQE